MLVSDWLLRLNSHLTTTTPVGFQFFTELFKKAIQMAFLKHIISLTLFVVTHCELGIKTTIRLNY